MTWLEEPLRWENPNGCYYIARVGIDLFGEVILSRYWGGKTRAGGSEKHEVIRDPSRGLDRLREIAKTRIRTGYRLVSGQLPS